MTLDEVADYLVANVPGFTKGTNFFGGMLPEHEPVEACAIYEQTSASPVYMFGPDGTPTLEQPRLQVYSRSASYESARTKCWSMWSVLVAVVNQEIGGVMYQRISSPDVPYLLNRDSNGAVIFSCNFDVMKELSPTP